MILSNHIFWGSLPKKMGEADPLVVMATSKPDFLSKFYSHNILIPSLKIL